MFRNWQPVSGRLSDPDRVVTRLDSFITAYGARAVLFELWNSNPTIFEVCRGCLIVQNFSRNWRFALRTWWTGE